MCPLCMLVLLCIAIEAIICLCCPHLIPKSLNIIIIYSGLFLLASGVLQYIQNMKQNDSLCRRNQIDLLKLKRKSAIFQSESIPVNPTTTPIIFGENNSSVEITTMISPNCRYCRNVVSELLKLQNAGVKFKWNIILGQTVPKDSEKIDSWIRWYYADKDKFLENLYKWGDGTIASIPISQCMTAIDEAKISEIKQFFEREIRDLNISGFPQIILNRRLLSSIYTAKDFEFIIFDKNE